MAKDENKIDLELVDSQALLDELAKRFDYMIFASEEDVGNDQTNFKCHYRGPVSIAIGMAHRAIRKWISADD